MSEENNPIVFNMDTKFVGSDGEEMSLNDVEELIGNQEDPLDAILDARALMLGAMPDEKNEFHMTIYSLVDNNRDNVLFVNEMINILTELEDVLDGNFVHQRHLFE